MNQKLLLSQNRPMYVFGDKGELLPAHAIHGFENLEKLFARRYKKPKQTSAIKLD